MKLGEAAHVCNLKGSQRRPVAGENMAANGLSIAGGNNNIIDGSGGRAVVAALR